MIERILELSPTDYRDLIRETARDMGVQEGIGMPLIGSRKVTGRSVRQR